MATDPMNAGGAATVDTPLAGFMQRDLVVLTFVVLLRFKVSELWLTGAAAIIGLVLNGAP